MVISENNSLNYNQFIDILNLVLTHSRPIIKNTYNIGYINTDSSQNEPTRENGLSGSYTDTNLNNSLGNIVDNIMNRNNRTRNNVDNSIPINSTNNIARPDSYIESNQFSSNGNFNSMSNIRNITRPTSNLTRRVNSDNLIDETFMDNNDSDQTDDNHDEINHNQSLPRLTRVLNDTRNSILRTSNNQDLNPTNFEIYISEKSNNDEDIGDYEENTHINDIDNYLNNQNNGET